MGSEHPISVLSGMLLFRYADGRSSDDVIAF